MGKSEKKVRKVTVSLNKRIINCDNEKYLGIERLARNSNRNK